MTEETVGWIGEAADQARVPAVVEPTEVDGGIERGRRPAAVGKIAIALVVAWTSLVAIPGALPWVTADESTRAIAFGIVIASIVALGGLALAWLRDDELAEQGATVGMAAAFAALGLAALEVVNVMVLPADASYRLLATGIGLLVLIAVALAAVAAVRASFSYRFRVSPLALIGLALGIVVVVAYLLMLQAMVAGAPNADDAEWARLTTLLAGMQTLVFGGLGALLGAVLQGQATSAARSDLRKAEEAVRLLETETTDIVREIRARLADSEAETDAVLLQALRQDPSRFRTEAALRRWIASNRPEPAVGLADLAEGLDQVVASARRIHAA
ncbi:MAG TPA: hypothetical protein VFW95_05825 [Candidatus Limnocylindria bacterium]|nr:hypothetical protein [Candidatus Limnocylindria bacterium]